CHAGGRGFKSRRSRLTSPCPGDGFPCVTLPSVSDLAKQHCEPCEKGTPPLSEQEAAALASEVPDWERDGNRTLKREFSFANFRDSFGFVARVALLAEAEQHHPDIELAWGRAAF